MSSNPTTLTSSGTRRPASAERAMSRSPCRRSRRTPRSRCRRRPVPGPPRSRTRPTSRPRSTGGSSAPWAAQRLPPAGETVPCRIPPLRAGEVMDGRVPQLQQVLGGGPREQARADPAVTTLRRGEGGRRAED